MLKNVKGVLAQAEATAADAACNVAYFDFAKAGIGAVVVAGVSLALSYMPHRNAVHATVKGAADTFEERRIKDVTVTPRVVTSGSGQYRIQYTEYAVAFDGKFPSIVCNTEQKSNAKFPVRIGGDKDVACQSKEWNDCAMTVSYDDKEYSVHEKRGGRCSPLIGDTQKLYYDPKGDTMSSTNMLGVRTALQIVRGIAVCAVALEVAKGYLIRENCSFSMQTAIGGKYNDFAKQYDRALKAAKANTAFQAVNSATSMVTGSQSIASDVTQGAAGVSSMNLAYQQYLTDKELYAAATKRNDFTLMWTVANIVALVAGGMLGYRLARQYVRKYSHDAEKPSLKWVSVFAGLVAGVMAASVATGVFRGYLRQQVGLSFFDYPMIAFA